MKYLLFIFLSINICFADKLYQANNFNEAIEMGKKQNKQIIAFFYSQQCPWCSKMKKNTLNDKKVIRFINSQYIFVSIDKDNDKFPDEFYPRFIPTTYLIDPSTKEEIFALYGYKSSKEFINDLLEE